MPAPGGDALERTVDLLSSAEEEEDAVPGVEAPGATHLFEEEGALDRVAALARDWFLDRLA